MWWRGPADSFFAASRPLGEPAFAHYVQPGMTALARILPENENEAISDVLNRVLEQGGETISVDELVQVFGHRAFGALLFIFSAPNFVLPLPPGSSTILSVPLVLISAQIVLGMQKPWVPRFVGKRQLSRTALRKGFSKVMPRLRKVETFSRPRWGILFGPVQDRLIGLVCLLLSLILILPIVFGNVLPGASVSAFGLSLTQRDGVLAMIGFLLTTASIAVLVLSAGAVIAAMEKLVHMIGM